MVNSKSPNARSGVAFIEIVVTVMIIGSLLSALFVLQGNVLRRVVSFSKNETVVFDLVKFLADVRLGRINGDKEVGIEKKYEKHNGSLKYRLKSVDENSSLKNFKDIKIETAECQWDRFGVTRMERVVTFTFRPESAGK